MELPPNVSPPAQHMGKLARIGLAETWRLEVQRQVNRPCLAIVSDAGKKPVLLTNTEVYDRLPPTKSRIHTSLT